MKQGISREWNLNLSNSTRVFEILYHCFTGADGIVPQESVVTRWKLEDDPFHTGRSKNQVFPSGISQAIVTIR